MQRRFIDIITCSIIFAMGLLFCLQKTSSASVSINAPVQRLTEEELAKHQWEGRKSSSVVLPLMRNGSEGFLFVVISSASEACRIALKSPISQIRVRLFKVESVIVASGEKIPDILVPLRLGRTRLHRGVNLYYARVSASDNADAAKNTISIVMQCKHDTATLRLTTEVLPIRISNDIPLVIQGSIWPINDMLGQGDDKYRAGKIEELLRMMKEYKFNGAAGMWGKGMVGTNLSLYGNLVRYCLDDLQFKRVRIPSGRRYNSKRDMQSEYGGKRPSITEIAALMKKHLAAFSPILKNPAWKGKLELKTWDEPRRNNYKDVVLMYKASKMADPSLLLELSEEPDPALDNVADVWTVHIDHFRPRYVETQHRMGKEVWLYANRLHRVIEPLKSMRIIAWLLWRYRMDGYLFWAVNWWNVDHWHVRSSWGTDFYKAGTFFYPDATTGNIYPSLRIEAFRDGIEDYMLLDMLEKKGQGEGSSASAARTLIRQCRFAYDISSDYRYAVDPGEFRRRMLDVLSGK